MQTEEVHNLVHDKSGTGHIASIFHQGDKEEKDQNIGKKYNHSPYTSNDAVHQHIPEDPFLHICINEETQQIYPAFDPAHGIVPQGKGGMKHKPEKAQKNGKTKVFMGKYPVDPL